MASVSIRDVTKTYGNVNVMHGVSVDIADGEFVVLVGPSGCGKSTLLRMIAGLEEITAGEIAIGERVVNDLPAKERDIAMVFQNYALYPHMTVADNMGFALMLAEAPKAARSKQPGRDAPPKSSAWKSCWTASAPAFRRPAPARRHGPRHRARSAGLPLRRAAVQSRRQAARADAQPRSRSCISASARRPSMSPMTRSRR